MNKILSSSVIALSLAIASVHLYANDKVVQRDTSKATNIQEIRNATIKVNYAVTTFSIDPMIANKGFYACFPDTHRSYVRNALVDLPSKPERIVVGLVAVIVTRTPLDHRDAAAHASIPKNMPLFVQIK